MATNKPRTTRSMRGEEVNFDLAEIKNKILADPEPEASRQRARFIDSKRRRTRRRGDEIVAEQKNNEAAVRAAIAEQKRAQILEEKSSVPHLEVEEVVVSDEAQPARKIKRD